MSGLTESDVDPIIILDPCGESEDINRSFLDSQNTIYFADASPSRTRSRVIKFPRGGERMGNALFPRIELEFMRQFSPRAVQRLSRMQTLT